MRYGYIYLLYGLLRAFINCFKLTSIFCLNSIFTLIFTLIFIVIFILLYLFMSEHFLITEHIHSSWGMVGGPPPFSEMY